MPQTHLLAIASLRPAALIASCMLLLTPASLAQDAVSEEPMDDSQTEQRAASGQENPAAAEQVSNPARDILLASRQSLVENGVFAAKIEVVAEMEALFAGMLPTADATYLAASNEDGTWNVRVAGSGKPFGKPDITSFDVIWTGSTVTTLESDVQKVLQGPADRVRGTSFTQAKALLGIPGLTEGNAPYTEELEGRNVTLELAQPANIGDVRCQIIRVTLSQGRSTRYQSIAVGAEDFLPRQIMIHPQGFDGSNSIGTRFTEISTDPEAIGTVSWTMETPDGYELETITAPVAQRRAPANQSEAMTEQTGAKLTNDKPLKPTPLYQLSPKWQMQTADGTVVSNETLKGKVAVLYFWGTWCIPCRKASPLNKELFADFGEQKHFEMVGLAVRERDPQAAYDYASENGYAWTQLVGADKPATMLGVQRYPTWIVVGPAGELLYTSGQPEGGEFETIFEEIRAAVTKGIEMAKN